MIVNKAYTKPRPTIHRFKGTHDKPIKTLQETTLRVKQAPPDPLSNLPTCLLDITKSIELFCKKHTRITKNILHDENVKESFRQAATMFESIERNQTENTNLADTSEQSEPSQDISHNDALAGLSNEIHLLRELLQERETEIRNLKEEKEKLESSLIQWPDNFTPPETQPSMTKVQERKRKDKKFEKAVLSQRENNLSQTDGSSNSTPSPSRLAEMHADLYDNEWRDAFKSLSIPPYDEKVVAEKLLTIFKDSYKCCWSLSREHLEMITRLLQIPENIFCDKYTSRTSEKNEYVYNTSSAEVKMIKDIRKMIGETIIQKLSQCYIQHRADIFGQENNEVLERFAAKCIAMCWLICVQDNPLDFEFDIPKGGPIDKTKLISYSNTGKIVDYMMWPVLLKNDGSVLARGVVRTV